MSSSGSLLSGQLDISSSFFPVLTKLSNAARRRLRTDVVVWLIRRRRARDDGFSSSGNNPILITRSQRGGPEPVTRSYVENGRFNETGLTVSLNGLFSACDESARGLPLLKWRTGEEGFRHISTKFETADHYEPRCVRRFVEELAVLGGMSADQWQQDAFAQVDAWLKALGIRKKA
ncbi:MAG: hypothetical protein EOP84_19785 [Verrucomicrobiaceae bacterium]|nr:MAG: hypothetical protein EOP84_19785 [Verrucomicrobiaceae bacterium]